MTQKKYSQLTQTIRAGIESDEAFGAVSPPIHMSTNYTFEGLGKKRPFDYSRSGNPTRAIVEQAIADLEGGAGAVVTSTGMAALATVFHLLKPGDVLVAPHDCYGGTHRLLQSYHQKGFCTVRFIDQTNGAALQEAFAAKPKMVLIETPSNPLLRITDIEQVVKLAKTAGTMTVADNTFMSPVFQKPFDFGVDLIVHSTTKYLNGHSDIVGGAIVGRTKALADEVYWWANNIGTTGAAFDSFLTLRGMRTLDLRVRRQAENAAVIADFLAGQAMVERTFYPGLKTHPGHDLAKRQQTGFGSMVSFELKGGIEAVRRLVDNLSLFSLAESLGGFESLIAHPPTMTHAAMDPEARKAAGIGENFLRLSVGLEDAGDLVADLRAGIEASQA
jgi:cystathionine gamma-synthase